MDEQTQVQEQEIDSSSADDYADYSDDDYSEEIPPDDLEGSGEEPEISLQDGEVNFRDDFFGDLPKEQEEQEEEQQVPNYYTDEELQNTPFEQWDYNRMPDEVKRYANYLNAQRQTRQQQQQIAEMPLPDFIQEVKPYTAKELANEAEKLAIDKLGLDDPDDFDIYDSEHSAALNMAMQELSGKRNAEIANYQKRANDYRELERMNAQIKARPDFAEYYKWFNDKAMSEGTSAAQLNQALLDYARQGGDIRSVQQVVSGWYQMFQNTKKGKSNSRTRKPSPPRLESSRGGYDGEFPIKIIPFLKRI